MTSTLSTTLTSVLSEKVLVPGTEDYDTANNSYFTAFENEIKPSYIAKPTSVEEVSKLVAALHPHLASGEAQLAVRGTGHTPFGGSANIKDGITVDLRALKGVQLSEDKATVDIGCGETWTSVYSELEKHGLTTAGGRVGRVGVTGLLLIHEGGLSLYSTRRGFACDSVTEFSVVLASGIVVKASAKENSDLWIALKGGLNNFGIVTSFKMKTFETGPVWGGVTYYLQGTCTQLIEAVCDFALNEKDEDTHIMCGAGYGFGHQVTTCVMYQTKGVEDAPSLKRFTTIQPQIEQMKTMRTGTHLGFCDELSAFSTDGTRQLYLTCTIKPDVSLMEAFHDKWQETLATLKDSEGFIFSFNFQPLTEALLQNSANAGGNSMNISPDDGPLLVVLLNPVWNLAADDERIISGVSSLLATFKNLASEKGMLHRYIFINYAYEKEDVFKGFGDESQRRLKAASEKWDPEGIFQKAVPGGFKVSSTWD
ncbi:FAD-binding domain-containing protein [Lophium mytilinum]|uniref:FAD-binding domain-containing protein n=1 Tax=Lophium mytilinum TaxID=390894 RepID=A0A6A6Q8B6_9PEZI|nr:FAD-binding domain-containing protein [Lophium mytilinum]